jgi:HAD superfamily hydrolase (TIGR01509 family)
VLKKPFEAIIFDLDGVIINSETLWDESSRIFLKRRGLTYHRSRVKPLCTGKSLIDGTAIIKAFYHLCDDTRTLAEERKSIVGELYHEKIDFIDDCEQFLRRLKQENIPMAIATSSDTELLEIVLQRLNLTAFFGEQIYTLAQVDYLSKPSPAIFLFVANRLGIPPAECIVIEDSPNGVQAAKNANMFCIGIETTYNARLLEAADIVLKNYAAIEAFLMDGR